MRSLFREAWFAGRYTKSTTDAVRLLGHTAHFHLANRGLTKDRQSVESVKIRIGDRWRDISLRTGRIGDLFIFYEVLAFRAYAIPPALIEPRDVSVIVDCGANIGLTALYFASVYPDAHIYSVEADPDSFALLQANTHCEPRITPIHACVVAEPRATATFNANGPAWGRKQASDGIRVPAITLLELLQRYAIQNIDLLKLDIEGAEREILASGEFLRSVDHLVVELHEGYSLADFARAIGVHGLEARPPDRLCNAITAHRQRNVDRPIV